LQQARVQVSIGIDSETHDPSDPAPARWPEVKESRRMALSARVAAESPDEVGGTVR